MATHNLTVPLLAGNGVPVSEISSNTQGAAVKAVVEIAPAYQFQREDGALNWAVVNTFTTDTASITIAGMEDADTDGADIIWQMRVKFLDRANGYVGGDSALFKFADAAPTEAAYPDNVILQDVALPPEYGPTWAVQAEAAAVAAQQAQVAAQGYAAAAQAVGDTNDSIMASIASSPGTAFATALNSAVTPPAQTAAANYLASQPGVESAATTAVNNKVAGLDIVLGTDPNIPNEIAMEDDSWQILQLDKFWRFISGVDKDGNQVFTSATIGEATIQSYPLDQIAYVPMLSKDGRRSSEGTLGPDWKTPKAELKEWRRRQTMFRNAITSLGDSLTAGAFGDGVSYPQELANLTGLPVHKRAYPGRTTATVAALWGADPLLVTVTGGVIPASGGVTVTLSIAPNLIFDAVQGTPDDMSLRGWLNGIDGVITQSGSVYTFTRTYAGGAYNAATPMVWVDKFASNHRDDNLIIWLGRNGYTATDLILAYTRKIVDYQHGGDVLVMGITTNQSETTGTAANTSILNTNYMSSQIYGDHFVDIRVELMTVGLALAGITPTTADTTAIASGTLPPSLVAADGGHLNSAGYKAVALIVRNKLTTLGWI